ncbi:MAG TPA: FAD-binding protein, partial [Pyrinomonadaceae bacterium]
NAEGKRFMPRYHERAELAPRDIVSRAIVAELERTATRTAFIDMTALDGRYLRRRFPKIYDTCLRYGLDMTRELIPVSPAAHYIMGGVRTDLDGRTTVAGLYAAGEVACTGVHGANRLASNSLLEGLVFGARAGRAATREHASDSHVARRAAIEERDAESAAVSDRDAGEIALAVRKRVRRLMWERVGILRSRQSLTRALGEFEQIERARSLRAPSRNFVTVALLVARAALWREESRGAHFRYDFPERDDARWRVHSIARRGAPVRASETVDFSPADKAVV